MSTYHHINLADDETTLVRAENLHNIPRIIKSLVYEPELMERFLSEFEDLKKIPRKTTRIGVPGEKIRAKVFFQETGEAVEIIKQCVLETQGKKISKQGVFWLAAYKLRSIYNPQLSA